MAAKYGSRGIQAGWSIVLTSGLAGLRPQKGRSVMASICGALEALTRALAIELAPTASTWFAPALLGRNCGAMCLNRNGKKCSPTLLGNCRLAELVKPRIWPRPTCT
jgi:hypothetical protein